MQLSLKPTNFLLLDSQIKKAVDRLHLLRAQKKDLEAEEAQITNRLKEIALASNITSILGNQYVATISTEFQQRLNTAKLKASVKPADLVPFMNETKVVKITLAPISK